MIVARRRHARKGHTWRGVAARSHTRIMHRQPMLVEPVTLEGQHVRLEPLAIDHVDALSAVGLDPDLWTWIPAPVRTPAEMRQYVEAALANQAAGSALPFVTIARATNTVVGSSRFMNIDVPNRRVEIGSTWVGRPWQRSFVNTEAKLLMLAHAFERWGCIRVELKTDALNERSRNAIGRIGARQEGIFRQHMITHSGRLRDTVYFSIIDGEWPAVQARLAARLAQG
jgi:RimJ/RimL family protein N-acetyltransferase